MTGLVNGESESSRHGKREVQERHLNDRVCTRISKDEVRGALRKMKSEKTIGSDLIPVKIWKCLGKEGVD